VFANAPCVRKRCVFCVRKRAVRVFMCSRPPATDRAQKAVFVAVFAVFALIFPAVFAVFAASSWGAKGPAIRSVLCSGGC
jgi:hypothetical protein